MKSKLEIAKEYIEELKVENEKLASLVPNYKMPVELVEKVYVWDKLLKNPYMPEQ